MSAGRGISRTFSICLVTLAASFGGIASAATQNTAPVISGTPPTSARVGAGYEFTPVASDANDDRLAFTATGLPRWARIERKTGRVYGTPGTSSIGTSGLVRITVSDGKLTASLPAFTITVTDSSPPWISGTPPTGGREKELYGFVPSAGDADGDPLTYSVANKPAWATFTASSGLLSGIPPAGSAGTYSSIVISVSDGKTTSKLPAFSITVAKAANTAPTIAGSPATSVAAGSAYSFKPTASDPDGQALKFSIQGLPSWAVFDTASGALTGTPSSTQAGTYGGIVIAVTDGLASASLASFSIAVTTTNTAPIISGTPPAAATVGQSYSFTPGASDKEGQKLTFSIANRPAWAQFDSATGRLYGTPTSSSVGTYSSIRISVSDGQVSSSLAAFSIAVQSAAAAGTATLSWVPPTQNVDGTPVTNLAGYRIAYGQASADLDRSLDIPNPAITTAMIENLASGTWYFAVKAYTTAAVESDLSNLAQKTVN
jgi:hypothetical protein